MSSAVVDRKVRRTPAAAAQRNARRVDMLRLPSVAIGVSIATTPPTRVRLARRLSMPALACVVLFSLLGCAAIGVPATSDPGRKLAQAYQLMAIERLVPAEPL